MRGSAGVIAKEQRKFAYRPVGGVGDFSVSRREDDSGVLFGSEACNLGNVGLLDCSTEFAFAASGAFGLCPGTTVERSANESTGSQSD